MPTSSTYFSSRSAFGTPPPLAMVVVLVEGVGRWEVHAKKDSMDPPWVLGAALVEGDTVVTQAAAPLHSPS